jgi:hypothetical protein
MSFSFRNLFSQDKPMDASDASRSNGTAEPSSGDGENGQPGGPANPFSSAPFSNIFSDAGSKPEAPAESTQKPFVPNPLPTHRGSFEALFAGQGIGAPAASPPNGGVASRFTLREILPFLPPSLVAQGHLNLDRSVEVSLPADGSGEVKLSAIQRVCPEIFATEITPLNDSEITLPKAAGGAPKGNVPTDAWKPNEVPASLSQMDRGLPIKSSPMAVEAGRPGIFASAEAREPERNAVAAPSNPFAAPVSVGACGASPWAAGAMPIGNPFSASASELATKTPVAVPAAVSGFGFPDRKEAAPPFGAFGTPPVPASAAKPTPAKLAVDADGPWSGGAPASPSKLGFDLGFGESGPFASPMNVSLTPQSAPDPRPQPVEQPIAQGLPWEIKPESVDAAASPFGGPMPAAVGSNPFDGFPDLKGGENPFAPPAEPVEAAQVPETLPEKSASSWPFGESWSPLSETDLDAAEAKPGIRDAGPTQPVASGPSPAPGTTATPEEEREARSLLGPGSTGQSAGVSLPALPEFFFNRPASPAAAPTASSFGFSAPGSGPVAEVKPDPAEKPSPRPEAAGTEPSAESPVANGVAVPFVWPALSAEEVKPVSFFDQPALPADSVAPAAAEGDSASPAPFDFSLPWGPLEAPKKPEPVNSAPDQSRGGESVVFTLAEILRPMAKDAGLDLAAVPPQAKVRLPVSLIESQLATGSVSVTIRDLLRHAAADDSASLARVDPGILVALPENELYHQLSDFAPDLVFGSDEELEAQFSTLFGAEARADAGIGWENEILEDDPEPAFAAQPQSVKAAMVPEPAQAVAPAAEEPSGLEVAGNLPEAETPVSLPTKVAPAARPAVTVKAGKKPVDIAATVTPPAPASQPTPKSPTPSDPFAPLPRRKQAEPAATEPSEPALPVTPPVAKAAEALEEFETNFFDDLDLFSTSQSHPIAEFGDDEDLDDIGGDLPGAFPTNDTSHWGFSGFSTLEELEPEPKPARKLEAIPAVSKSPKFSVSVQKHPPKPVVEEPLPAGFFDELESSVQKPAARTAAAVVAPPPQPAAPEPVAVEVSPAPVVIERAPAIPAPAPEPVSQEIAPGMPRDIELRAVFGTNEPFTFLRVADLTAALPGITACSIIAPGCTAQAPRGRDAGDLAAQSGALLSGVRGIARATGMTNAETFTLYTDQGQISVFLHGDYCLTVRHRAGQFDPGVREKLILVTRGLAGLAG